VNTVTEFRVPLTVENFLTGCVTNSFSEGTLFHGVS